MADKTKPTRRELPKIDVHADVKEALMIRRARTGKPMWIVADEILREQLGLRPRRLTA